MNKLRFAVALLLNLGGLGLVLWEVLPGKVNPNEATLQEMAGMMLGVILWSVGLGITLTMPSHPYDNQWTGVNRILRRYGVLAVVFVLCWFSRMPVQSPWPVFAALMGYATATSIKEVYLLGHLRELHISWDSKSVEQVWVKPLYLARMLFLTAAVIFAIARLSTIQGALVVSGICSVETIWMLIAKRQADKDRRFPQADLLLFTGIMIGGMALLALIFAGMLFIHMPGGLLVPLFALSAALYYQVAPPVYCDARRGLRNHKPC